MKDINPFYLCPKRLPFSPPLHFSCNSFLAIPLPAKHTIAIQSAQNACPQDIHKALLPASFGSVLKCFLILETIPDHLILKKLTLPPCPTHLWP